MKYNLNDIVNNGELYTPILEEVGIKTTEDLVTQVANTETRKKLSERTGIGENKLLHFLHSADLLRIKGVGTLYAALLCEAGICSANELAEWEPAPLYEFLTKTNDRKELVQNLPTEEQLDGFIQQAKELPNLVITTQIQELPKPTFLQKYGTSIGMLVFGAVIVGLSVVFRRQISAAYKGIAVYNGVRGAKNQIGNWINKDISIDLSHQMQQVKEHIGHITEQIDDLRK